MLGFPQNAHWSTGNVHRVRGITDIGHAVIDPPTEDGHGEKLSLICFKNKSGGFLCSMGTLLKSPIYLNFG